MNTVVSLLLLIVCSSFRNSSDYSLALTLLEHIKKIESLNKEKLLEESGVSNHSLTRFCQMLGYKSFSSLKLAISQTCTIRKQQMIVHYNNTCKEDLLNKIEVLSNLEFNREVFIDTVNKINQIINQFENIVIIGSVYPETLCLHYMEDMIMLNKLAYSIPLGMEVSEQNSAIMMVSLTGRLYVERFDDVQRINHLNIPIIGIGNKNTLPDTVHVQQFLSLPFNGDTEIENSAIPLIMQYIKYDYINTYHGGII